MIQRLNFYDVYGYLLPGIVFLALAYAPFGIVFGALPDAKLLSAFVLVVAGYIAGHLIQGFAKAAFPSKIVPKHGGDPRYPSVYLLDDEDNTLSSELKTDLTERLKSQFDLDVTGPGENLEQRRQDAFFMCRRLLSVKAQSSYAEQYQGMYVLMRGVTAALFLFVFYAVGWSAGASAIDLIGTSLGLQILFGYQLAGLFVSSPGWIRESSALWLLVLGAALIGAYLGTATPTSFGDSTTLALIAAIALLFIQRTNIAQTYFAHLFASGIYREFLALQERTNESTTTHV